MKIKLSYDDITKALAVYIEVKTNQTINQDQVVFLADGGEEIEPVEVEAPILGQES